MSNQDFFYVKKGEKLTDKQFQWVTARIVEKIEKDPSLLPKYKAYFDSLYFGYVVCEVPDCMNKVTDFSKSNNWRCNRHIEQNGD